MRKRWLILAALALVAAPLLANNPPYHSTTPGDIAAQFSAMRISWMAGIFRYAQWLFGALLVIDLVYTGFQLALESGWTFKEWGASLLRWILSRGFWGAVMLNGAAWIPSIIDSFTKIGVNAAGLGGPLSPNDVWNMGLDLASKLGNQATTAAWLTDPGSAMLIDFAMGLIVASFAVISATLIVTLAESWLTLSVGYLFTGFGGSRWTEGYARNFINLSIAIGTKIIVLYCIISAAQKQVAIWQVQMGNIDAAAAPLDTALDILGGSLLLAICAWMIPKALSAIATGALGGHHGDMMAPVMTMAGIASMGASLALKGAGIGSAISGAAGSAGKAASGGAGKSARGSMPGQAASSGGAARPVPPPPLP